MSYTPTSKDLKNVNAWKQLISKTASEGPMPRAPESLAAFQPQPDAGPPPVHVPPAGFPDGIAGVDQDGFVTLAGLDPNSDWAKDPNWGKKRFSFAEVRDAFPQGSHQWDNLRANTNQANTHWTFDQQFYAACHVGGNGPTGVDTSQPYIYAMAIPEGFTVESFTRQANSWKALTPMGGHFVPGQ